MASFYPNVNTTDNYLYMYYPNGLIVPVVDASGALRPASLVPGVPKITEIHSATQTQKTAHEKALAATNAYMSAFRAQREAVRTAAGNAASAAAKKQAEEKAAADAAETKKKAEIDYLKNYVDSFKTTNPGVAAAIAAATAPAPAAVQPAVQYVLPQFAAPPKPANQPQLFWMPGAQAPTVIPAVAGAPAPKAATATPAAGGYYAWQNEKWVYKA
ncbi:hypothetical protein BZA77DRAFT_361578 [Pyronema omphalodes]|nr:hypothetical protein BZA77DRAFT_361578 [Pyronema omphalodes]